MSEKLKKIITPARVMCFLAFIVLTAASVMSFGHKPIHVPVLPKPEYTVFIINLVTAIFCAYLVICPQNWKAQCAILFIQAISTTLTGYETLGIFLYSALIILLFVNGFFKKGLKWKIHLLSIIWILVIAGYGTWVMRNLPKFQTNEANEQMLLLKGIQRIVLMGTTSAFFFGFYYYVYKKLEVLLVTLVPAKGVTTTNKNLPKIGSELKLSDFNLTDRQSKLVLEYLATQKNYEALGEQFFISKSTVKKDMTEVFDKFGVTNLKELHILLLQYIVVA